jgi:hypothetical protein
MKNDLRDGVRLATLLLTTLLAMAIPASAQEAARPPATSIATASQPFVDRHALAGAVTLVADKDRVLGLDAVGFADVAARTPFQRRGGTTSINPASIACPPPV